MTSYLTSMDTISLSLTGFEIFDFKVFRVWPWPSSAVKKFYTIRKFIYDLLFDFHGQHLSISYRSRDIRLQSFSGLTLTLTSKDHMGSIFSYRLKAHIWLTVWLLWTPSLYLLPFSRYLTSKKFRVWLWPLTLKGHLGSKIVYTVRKPIYDLLFDFYGHHLSSAYRFRDIRF